MESNANGMKDLKKTVYYSRYFTLWSHTAYLQDLITSIVHFSYRPGGQGKRRHAGKPGSGQDTVVSPDKTYRICTRNHKIEKDSLSRNVRENN